MGRKSVQDAIRDRQLGQTAKLPVSVLGRLGRTALTGARGGGLMLFRDLGAGDRELSESDIEALTRFVQTLGQMKGIAMKFGQILSYIDLDVPEEMSRALAVLQTQSPSMPFEAVAGIVRQDLGARAEVLMKNIDRRPAAAASIGQVHRATLDDGSAVAVKVRYPDIDKAIENDFSMASFGTGMARMMFPGARLESMIEEARSRFLLECDYQHEARLQERFRNLYDGHPTIVVPPVFGEFCSTRVLTTGWMDGLSFDAWLASGPSQADRDRIGQALFEFYIGTLFQHGLYNCDPHPGNYVFLTDGRVAVLDYGCTREFDVEFRNKLANLTRAVHADDREMLHQTFLETGMVRAGHKYDFDTARDLVRSFFGPMLQDQVQSIPEGKAITFKAAARTKFELMKLSLPGEFLFLFRIRFGLMSILARMGSRANWYRMERAFTDSMI